MTVASCCLLLVAGGIVPAAQKRQDTAAEMGRAKEAQQQGNYKAAEEIYLGLLANDPDLTAAQFGLGATYYVDHQYEQSNKYLLKTLQKQPDLFPALLLVGINYLKLGGPEQAIPYLKRAVRERPTDEFANHNLASAEYIARDYPAACADYTRFLRMQGRQDDAFSWYGFGEITLLLSGEVAGRLGDVPRTDPSRLRYLSGVYEEMERWGLAAGRLQLLEDQPAWRTWAKLHLGQLYLRQGQPAPAVEEFRQVLASDPQSAEAHFGLGVGLLLQGKQAAALPEFAAAAGENPWLFSHPESIQQMASAAHVTILPPSGSSGQALVDAFIEQLAGSSANPDVAPSSSFLAQLHEAYEQRHKENEKKVEAALGPGTPAKDRLKLAEDLLEEGDIPSASDALRKFTPATPSDRDPVSILEAKLAVARGEPLDAAEALLPLVRGKESPENCLTISTLLQQVGQQAMDELLRISPEGVFAHLIRAQVAGAHHQPDLAISEYQQAVQLAPNDPTTHLKLGEYLWQQSKYQEAIVALERAVSLDPHNAAAHYQLGNSYVHLAEPNKALPSLVDAARLDPTLDVAVKDLGKIYYDQGNYEESVRVLKKAADRDFDGSVNYQLFSDYSRLHEPKEAAACLAKFQELSKAHANNELFTKELRLSPETSETSPSEPTTLKQ